MPRLLAIGLLLIAARSFAQTCPTRDGSAAGRSDAARLRFLSSELLAESHRAHNWTLAWGATYGLLTLGQLAAVPLISPEDQVEWWVAAATTGLGAVFLSLDPLEVMHAGAPFARRASQHPDRCASIAEGEGLLERSASHQQRATRWYIHATNVALNLGLGLILGLGYGHWVAGAVNFALGVAFGEATILTSPTRLVSAWAEYQRGELGKEPSALAWRVFPILSPQGAGLGLALDF